MARNIEIKARMDDINKHIALTQTICDWPMQILHQEDVFFNCENGRLKLRKFPIDMAKVGVATDTHREFFINMGGKLFHEQNVDAVVLAGTDLCLEFDGQDYGYPVVDCAQVHVDEIVAVAS